jgi:hypothetical protein
VRTRARLRRTALPSTDRPCAALCCAALLLPGCALLVDWPNDVHCGAHASGKKHAKPCAECSRGAQCNARATSGSSGRGVQSCGSSQRRHG